MNDSPPSPTPTDAKPKHPHIVSGEFQSDKYPTCPAGKVPLSTKDKTAQDLLWEYARRRRIVDPEFSADLEICLLKHGYEPKRHTPSSGQKGGSYGCEIKTPKSV
jgi:hypothetical protein